MEFITKSGKETQDLAKRIILGLGDSRRKSALVLGLVGDLGAGKTTFIQGLAGALKIKEKVLSPTFVIMKHFNIPAHKNFGSLYHIDCYRIEKSDELVELNISEILKNPEHLIVIEWAEKIKKILPQDAIWINFEHLGENRRRIKIQDL